jgi:N-acylneuraminate cytidylyltransferase
MNSIAVIPARAGSKRIPNKNIYPLMNKPVIAYAIENALNSGLFSEVFVSTDSQEIASVAQAFGAKIRDLRKPELSDDRATTIEVISDFVASSLKSQECPDFICCIYPVTPLLSAERLHEGFNLLTQYPSEFIFAALPTDSSPERNFLIETDLKIVFARTGNENTRTQDLQKYFRDAGQFYWGSRESWIKNNSILGAECRAVEFEKYEVIDVDEIEDMTLIETLLKGKIERPDIHFQSRSSRL